jgi:adenine deaminase
MGLLSDTHSGDVADDLQSIEESLRNLGVLHQRPFLLLSVMSLSVSPYFKFTDKGIIDTEQRRLLSPWER